MSPSLKELIKRFCIIVLFGIGFGYVEAAVVVYLRHIFYPDGFTFPLAIFEDVAGAKYLLLTEIAREAATLVIIVTSTLLFGRNRYEKWAAFLTIFAVWDIFYYVWLKVILNWPASIMDWDILFLIPLPWASPVLAPVLVSLTMLFFAAVIFYKSLSGKSVGLTMVDRLGLVCSALVIVLSFCIGGLKTYSSDYHRYFNWPLFAIGNLSAIAFFCRNLLRKRQ
jgi:hypothetical protein